MFYQVLCKTMIGGESLKKMFALRQIVRANGVSTLQT